MRAFSLIKIKKEFLITVFFTVVCIFFSEFVKTENVFQQIFAPLFFLVIVPIAYGKIVLGMDFKSMGLGIGNWKTGLKLGSFFVGILGVAYIFIFLYSQYSQKYFLAETVKENFFIFLAYEFFLVGIFYFIYEFFFRGFLLFVTEKYFGRWAVFLQALATWIFFLSTQGFNWNNAHFILAAPLAGVVAYKSRSIWYFVLAGLFFSIVIDAFFIKFFK